MNSRIMEIRKSLKLTQEEFAKRLGLSRNYVWMIENGDRTPSDRTIADICRIFGVDEAWLRDGIGEPFREADPEEAVQKALAKALGGSEESKAKLIRAVANLPEELADAAIEVLRNLAEQFK